METTLLTAGIACLMGAIVGGGLKAFSIELPILNSVGRQMALGALGLVLILASFRTKANPTSSGNSAHPPPAPPHLTINYSQLGGPFLRVGTDPSSVMVPNSAQGHWWNEMDVLVQNSCNEPIDIDPSNFSLYISAKPNPDNVERFVPTTGLDVQPQRLKAGWVQTGASVSGRLIFEVPTKTNDGTETNGAYHILRFYVSSSCQIVYKPY